MTAIRVIETCWITLSDGCRLAATVWLPENAGANPVPAILEYLPYRRRDGTYLRDRQNHPYFAAHGYAAVRVDMRGSGDSDGLLLDEYLPQEQRDGAEVIAWLAAQPWCSGAVGMMGISWGGFNALQVASHRPPALKAIITVCSTDDRYADDCHFMGGCLLNNSLAWASTMFALGAQPPDPLVVGERWREMWQRRLEHTPLLIEQWMAHQTRDEYWRQGSVCENPAAITAAVYAVGGWADAYSNAIPRMLERLPGPRKGLIGPWAHAYPHVARPGPAIGFLQEALRWWDHWLKGIDTGIMDEPMLRVWMQDSVRPAATQIERPGRWVAEAGWPPTRDAPLVLGMAPGRLGVQGDAKTEMAFASPAATGTSFGEWCPYGMDGEMPVDQRPDDGRSVVFDGDALAAPLEILGAPVATLELAADGAAAMVAVRLEDVAPDGASTLVTYGLLNLTHRDGHDRAVDLVPGEQFGVQVVLNDIAHRFAAGNRIRLALATGHWPIAWPSPGPVTLRLWPGASRLSLPVRTPRPSDDDLRPFEAPEQAPPPPYVIRRPARRSRVISDDPASGETTVTVRRERPSYHLPQTGIEVAVEATERYMVREGDPTAASAEAEATWRMSRQDGWSTRTETSTKITCTATQFEISASLQTFDGENPVASRKWRRIVPRHGV